MLDGSFLKQSFAASATFKDVWKYITDNNKSRGVPIVAIQVFIIVSFSLIYVCLMKVA